MPFGISTRRFFDPYTEDDDPVQGSVRRAFRGVFDNENRPDLTGDTSTTSQLGTNQDTNDAYFKTMRSLSETGPAMRKYTDFVANAPKEADYDPSWYTRIAAALSGAAAGYRDPGEGVRVAQSIRQEPYQRAVREYNTQGRGLQALAETEERDRGNQIDLIKNIRQNELENRKLGQQDRKLDTEEMTAKALSEYRKAQVADLERKGWIFYDDDKGNRIASRMGKDGTIEKQNMGPSESATKMGFERTRVANDTTNANANMSRAGSYKTIAGAAATSADANKQRANQSFAQPTQEIYADSMAVQQALRENPDWSGYVDKKTGQVKTSYWFYDPKKDPNFSTFTNRVKQLRDEIIRKNRVGGGTGFGNVFEGGLDLDQQ